jgi:hypothetical protein
LVDFDQWFLNRGVYLKYSSSDIEGIIKENNNVVFQLNDVSFQPENYIYDKTILIGNNEALINNVKTYIPFEMYKTEPNVISVSIKDQNTSFLFKMNKQMNITLMRHSNTTMGMSNHYNPTDTVIAFDNFKYLSASERSDITNTEIVQPLLITSKFNSNKNNVYSISKSDITSIFDGIDNDLSINVF